ncbi:unnamed protein product [Pleuronectes platessa]|uniref:Uncharacterized protein n=1 Tax=Pleuronectes platessa TaxID=8262 RepID=A0A9N7UTG9_PLEPL|nr:unnamed protein product [Pleuronectes platessa]
MAPFQYTTTTTFLETRKHSPLEELQAQTQRLQAEPSRAEPSRAELTITGALIQYLFSYKLARLRSSEPPRRASNRDSEDATNIRRQHGSLCAERKCLLTRLAHDRWLPANDNNGIGECEQQCSLLSSDANRRNGSLQILLHGRPSPAVPEPAPIAPRGAARSSSSSSSSLGVTGATGAKSTGRRSSCNARHKAILSRELCAVTVSTSRTRNLEGRMIRKQVRTSKGRLSAEVRPEEVSPRWKTEKVQHSTVGIPPSSRPPPAFLQNYSEERESVGEVSRHPGASNMLRITSPSHKVSPEQTKHHPETGACCSARCCPRFGSKLMGLRLSELSPAPALSSRVP